MSKSPYSLLQESEKNLFRTDLPSIEVGEKVEILVKRDLKSNRNLLFKGLVIKKKNENNLSYSFTVIHETERMVITIVFFYHLSPIKKITKVKKIRVRRANLNYIKRNLMSKKSFR